MLLKGAITRSAHKRCLIRTVKSDSWMQCVLNFINEAIVTDCIILFSFQFWYSFIRWIKGTVSWCFSAKGGLNPRLSTIAHTRNASRT